MAVRLEKLGWGKADGWLRLQMNYDLSCVRAYEKKIKVQPIQQGVKLLTVFSLPLLVLIGRCLYYFRVLAFSKYMYT